MTPRQAIEAGADCIGIGRPITRHPNPREAIARILDEVNSSGP
jgi:orotidine-5'-phosphate decarboxylase